MIIKQNTKTSLLFTIGIYCVILLQIAVFQIETGADEALRPFGILRICFDAAIVFLPAIFFNGKKWRVITFIWWILFAFWIESQMLYSRTYHDLMPVSSYFLVENFDGILFKSILGSIRLKDVILVMLMPMMLAVYLKFEHKLPLPCCSIKKRLSVIGIFSGVLFAFLVGECLKYNHCESGRMEYTFFSRFTNPVCNGLYYVKVNGLVPYGVYNLCNYLSQDDRMTQDDRAEIARFLSSQPQSDYKGPNCKGRNLILVIVESLNSWVVDFKVSGREVCPTLNSLCHNDSSLVALSCVPQVRDGRSSDGHFIYNVGLLPIHSGSVAISYCGADVRYPSLAKALTGYSSITIHCDSPSIWNNTDAFKAYGFEQNLNRYDIMSCLGDVNENEIKDRQVFETAIASFKKIKTPFYAQLITIAMHQPYNKCVVQPTWISADESLPVETRNYLEAVNYFDTALADFLESLRHEGLYDNSVIAIVSDHNEYDKNRIYDPTSTDYSPDDTFCTFLVLNPPLNAKNMLTGQPVAKKIDTVIGQIDVFPTLLDIMGVDYQWHGIGHSVLDSHVLDCAISRDGVAFGKNRSAEQRLRQAWDISDIMIRKGYFKK